MTQECAYSLTPLIGNCNASKADVDAPIVAVERKILRILHGFAISVYCSMSSYLAYLVVSELNPAMSDSCLGML